MMNLPDFNPDDFIKRACLFIKNMVSQSNSDGVVIGLSGGIDSSVVAMLSVKALGKDNVKGFILPSKTTSQEDFDDAILIANLLDISIKTISIEDFHNEFLVLCNHENLPKNNSTLASANVKPRIRMSILYYYATIYNSLVIGTGNKTELNVGYFTKHGDGGVDLLPIGDLYKYEVVQLAKVLNIPESIINKPPTAGLLPNQTDENELGMTYDVLDNILYQYLDNSKSSKQISDDLNISLDEVERIINLNINSQHKRKSIPILKKQ